LGCDGDDSDDEGAVSVNPETGGNDTNNPAPPQDAINENFDAWDGGGERFFTSKPDQQEDPSPYPDHNTLVTIGDRQALAIHHNAVDNDGYGFAVEFQLALDQQTDMSGEDYRISFDIYIPQVTADKAASVQFAFYETANYTPIYSKWFIDIPADTWYTIQAPILAPNNDPEEGNIDYSGFTNDPQEWIFDVVRIQTIVDGEGVELGAEVLYYVDNLVVTNVPAA